MNSPVMKKYGEERIAAGEERLVVDLGGCTGMDSTFMGTLAGIAARLSVVDGGVLEIADPGDRNRRSLEDLGLDFLMEIDPPSAPWRGQVNSVREKLDAPHAVRGFGGVQRTRHVLEAHQTLSNISDRNADEFKGVVSMLKDDLADKEEPSSGDQQG